MNRINNLPIPSIIAHRGNSSSFPENTLSAFYSAIEVGAHAVEFDVRMTGDKEVVVIHDDRVDRTTNGNRYVHHLCLEDVKKLDAGTWFNSRFEGEEIPTLSEVFNKIGPQIFMNIELKPNFSTQVELIRKTISLIKIHQMQEFVMISSFNPFVLYRVKRVLSDVPVALLSTTSSFSPLTGYFFPGIKILNLLHSQLTVEKVKKYYQYYERLYAWTVNTIIDIKRMMSLEIDGMITDKPQVAFSAIEVTG